MDPISIQNISPAKAAEKAGLSAKTDKAGATGFKEMLENSIKEINDVNVKADQAIENIAQGQVQDVHQVMIAVEKANLTFMTMMQIRNKLMDAYKEVMNMRF
jgi:flagellar hook-basal body complex protein FliE